MDLASILQLSIVIIQLDYLVHIGIRKNTLTRMEKTCMIFHPNFAVKFAQYYPTTVKFKFSHVKALF